MAYASAAVTKRARPPAILELEASQYAESQPEKLTLLSLADLPLLEVLSHLKTKDLSAAGQASPRLAQLTRTHRSLWRNKGKVRFNDIEGMLGLLRVAPPLDTLDLHVTGKRGVSAYYYLNDRWLGSRSWGSDGRHVGEHFKIKVFSEQFAGKIIWMLGQQTKHLRISYVRGTKRLGTLLASLQNALALETLSMTWDWTSASCTFRWPQVTALPRLRSLELESDWFNRFTSVHRTFPFSEENLEMSTSSLYAFRSLLRAHSAQLRSVSLYSAVLLPLMSSCASDLHKLCVVAVPGISVGLRRMQGLRDLEISGPTWGPRCMIAKAEAEVAVLFRSWQHQLKRLRLTCSSEDTLCAVGAGALVALTHLHLCTFPTSLGPLGAALAGLPALRALVLNENPTPEQLRGIPTDAIPSLRLLLLLQYENVDQDALRELVLRAPKSLHVVQHTCKCDWDDLDRFASSPMHNLFGRHPSAESRSCPECAEAWRDTPKTIDPPRNFRATAWPPYLEIEQACDKCK
ncbi:uncharacterized protein LOC113213260 [Frankliniella occidentalis]|uniref:Uncharacterized protein LOC113213260 n=1 Tax=Frankliniella occidentalis TaxID=133901 RepID=A0A6J1TBB6_FRAOC|nr:uncharacterized protein LOC113213260 [Frankliniella occidentalis]